MDRRSAIQVLGIGGAGSFLFLAAPYLSGHGVEQEPEASPTFRSDVRLVLLDVNVKDRDTGTILGLSKENFTVFEDGRPQQITVFDHNDLPVTVGIVVDESRSMTAKRNDVLTAAETFIQESNRDDQIFVLNFNDRVVSGLPEGTLFSDSIPQLRSALHRGVAEGKTALYDAVTAGLKQLNWDSATRRHWW